MGEVNGHSSSSPPSKLEQEAEVKGDTTLFRRHKRVAICCGVLFLLLLLLAMLILILALTVFKTKKPIIVVDDVTLENFNVTLLSPAFSSSLNLTLLLHLSVKNPNHASFKYVNSTALVYYHGTVVGMADIPAGRAPARRTEKIITTLKVLADRLLSTKFFFTDFSSGYFPVSVHTDVPGRISLLNIIKRHAETTSDCNMLISLQGASVQNMTCTYHVKL